MACDCIKIFNEKLKPLNSRIITHILIVPEGLAERPKIDCEQIEKGRGKHKLVWATATFCPFCGTRYEDEGKWVRDADADESAPA